MRRRDPPPNLNRTREYTGAVRVSPNEMLGLLANQKSSLKGSSCSLPWGRAILPADKRTLRPKFEMACALGQNEDTFGKGSKGRQRFDEPAPLHSEGGHVGRRFGFWMLPHRLQFRVRDTLPWASPAAGRGSGNDICLGLGDRVRSRLRPQKRA